jgi:hypothetical protein
MIKFKKLTPLSILEEKERRREKEKKDGDHI